MHHHALKGVVWLVLDFWMLDVLSSLKAGVIKKHVDILFLAKISEDEFMEYA